MPTRRASAGGADSPGSTRTRTSAEVSASGSAPSGNAVRKPPTSSASARRRLAGLVDQPSSPTPRRVLEGVREPRPERDQRRHRGGGEAGERRGAGAGEHAPTRDALHPVAKALRNLVRRRGVAVVHRPLLDGRDLGDETRTGHRQPHSEERECAAEGQREQLRVGVEDQQHGEADARGHGGDQQTRDEILGGRAGNDLSRARIARLGGRRRGTPSARLPRASTRDCDQHHALPDCRAGHGGGAVAPGVPQLTSSFLRGSARRAGGRSTGAPRRRAATPPCPR